MRLENKIKKNDSIEEKRRKPAAAATSDYRTLVVVIDFRAEWSRQRIKIVHDDDISTSALLILNFFDILSFPISFHPAKEEL